MTEVTDKEITIAVIKESIRQLKSGDDIEEVIDSLQGEVDHLEREDGPHLGKLSKAQEERRARQTTSDGHVVELPEESGLDREIAEVAEGDHPLTWADVREAEKIDREEATAARLLSLKRGET